MELLLRWLRERRPDVVGLQELKVEEHKFPREALEAEGYRAAVLGQRTWNGVAVLSRHEIGVVQAGLPGQEAQGSRLLTARTAGLSFTTIYCPNGKHVGHEDFPRKLEWFDALGAYLRRSLAPGEPAVLCGDLNIVPTPLDTCDEPGLRGTIFHTDEERARFRGLLDGGWGDIFRWKHPDERAYSWWDYRAGAFHRNEGLRLDFLLGSEGLRERVRSVGIDRNYRRKIEGLIPSDHAPVIADLD